MLQMMVQKKLHSQRRGESFQGWLTKRGFRSKPMINRDMSLETIWNRRTVGS